MIGWLGYPWRACGDTFCWPPALGIRLRPLSAMYLTYLGSLHFVRERPRVARSLCRLDLRCQDIIPWIKVDTRKELHWLGNRRNEENDQMGEARG
jgi:hypothetical protein